tara:strand:+ start:640 stop:1239 length:600 start_codon:yes stop_codon:yes gene_type:complete
MRKLLAIFVLLLIPITAHGYEYPMCSETHATSFLQAKNWDRCFGTIAIDKYFENLSKTVGKENPHNYEADITYTGEFKKGLPDGEGFAWLIYDSGYSDDDEEGYYEGQLSKGLPHGKGSLSYDIGILSGTWKTGCINWSKPLEFKGQGLQYKIYRKFGKPEMSYYEMGKLEKRTEVDAENDFSDLLDFCTFDIEKANPK